MTGGSVLLLGAVFVHWGVLQISLANLGVIAVMVVLLVLALLLPFPGHHEMGKPLEAEDPDGRR